MKMLIVGAGVIGTVYGAHVAAAGSKVSVLSHEPRTGEVLRQAFPPVMSSAGGGCIASRPGLAGMGTPSLAHAVPR